MKTQKSSYPFRYNFVIIILWIVLSGGLVEAQTTPQVDAGANHAIALKTDGTVWAWGINANGQLGNGTTTQSSTPTQVNSLSGVSQIAAGYYHSLALKNGTVWTWGANSNGQLGDGTTTQRTTPVQVPGLTNIVAISAGAYHSLALDSSGNVWAWGANANGQLGDGTITQRTSPVEVTTLSGINQISCGSYHNLAVNGSGAVFAWGYNSNGQLGDNTTTQRNSPVAVPSLSGISTVSAGAYHSMALTGSAASTGAGHVYAWGYNANGQTGNNTLVQSNVPVLLTGISNVTQICASNSYQSMAIKSDNTVWVWGYNWYGQCGLSTTTLVETPTQIAGFTGAVGLGAGNYACFIIKSDGTVLSSGSNAYGQLGNGTSDQRSNAAQALNLSNILKVSANGNHSLALDATGQVWAFGSNGSGQFGNNTTIQRATPVATVTGVTAIGTGLAHSIALKSDGTVLAWGEGVYGEIGDNTGRQRNSPVSVLGLSSITSISSNLRQNLALKADGTVWAWGSNSNGQLGDGSTVQRNIPVQVQGLTGVSIKAIAEGQYHSLALDSNGHVWAWGSNSNGQLGLGSMAQQLTPLQITAFGSAVIVAISAGQYHSLALDNTGHVWAWGANNYGQLGDSTTAQKIYPVALTTISGVSALSAGDTFSVALKSDTTVYSWGYNNYSQLGDGTTVSRTSPVAVVGVVGVQSLGAGVGHSLVVKKDGTVEGWGSNYWNELATGAFECSYLPLPGFKVNTTTRPLVTISSPSNNATVLQQHAQTLFTTASESGGTIANVTYYIDGTAINSSSVPGSHTISWTPTTWGNFTFTAIATDSIGNTSFLSAPVTVQVPFDSDNNGLPDWWELKYFNHIGNNPGPAPGPDGNGLTLLQDYQQGNDPTNYYSQNGGLITPTITIVSGNGQSSPPSIFAPNPLVVQVVNSANSSILVNAPVLYSADTQGGAIGSSVDDNNADFTYWDRTDATGQSNGYFQQPDGNNVTSTITVSAATQSVAFTESSAAAGPVATPGPGIYVDSQTVTLSFATYNSTIYYTTDGSNPTTSSQTLASGDSINISNSTLLKYYSVAYDHSTTPVTTALYVINPSPFAAGRGHSLLLKDDGTVWAWGADDHGQLGDSAASSVVPLQVAGINAAIAVGTGEYHSVAVDSNGRVWGWGNNTDGELGDGTQTQRNTAVQSGTISVPIAQVVGGAHHTLALGTDGSVWAWGDNSLGQLGTGDTTAHLSPTAITGLSNIVALAACGSHSMALATNGSVWCWGDNTSGQVGNGATSATGQLTPVQVLSAGSATAIACGTQHSVALMNDSSVDAWGADAHGELGDGATNTVTAPQPVPNLSGVTSIAANASYTICLQGSGTVIGWGNNDNAQLGPNCHAVLNTPTGTGDPTEYDAICAGGRHVLATYDDSTVWSWGNAKASGSSLYPTLPQGAFSILSLNASATAVSARGASSAALLSDGTGVAWGQNLYGNLGDETSNQQNSPTPLAGFVSGILLSYGSYSSIGIDSNGNAYTWGLNSNGQLGRSVTLGTSDPNPTTITSLTAGVVGASSGDQSTVLLDSLGNVWGAGDPGSLGQIGSDITSFTQLSGLSHVLAISSGANFNLALNSDGTVSILNSAGISSVSGLSSISAITACGQHAFAIDSSGNVWAWGDNADGQLGDGSTTARINPVELTTSVFNNEHVIKVAGDTHSSIALTSAGHVWTWGDNAYSQLGDGTTTAHLTPQQVSLQGKVIDVAMATYHSVIIREDGTVVTCGINLDGELGNGASLVDGTPNQVMGLGIDSSAPTIAAPSSPPSSIAMGTAYMLQPTATASSGDSIAKIIYYNDGIEIGESSDAPFSLAWTPSSYGDYHINFVAVDDQGLLSTPLSSPLVLHVAYDSDGNGLPDWWELQYFGQIGNDPSSSPDGNSLTLLQDYQQGNDPTNYYSQNGTNIAPVLTVVSGNGLTTTSGAFMTSPLVVQVTDFLGNPLPNAPVLFTVMGGKGLLAASLGGTTSTSLLVTSNSSGLAQAYFQQPLVADYQSTVSVSAPGDPVNFTENTNPDTGPPAAPTNCVAAIGYLTGEIDLTWTNNADNASYLTIEQSTDQVNWTTTAVITDPTAFSYQVKNLQVNPPQPYYFRISAGN